VDNPKAKHKTPSLRDDKRGAIANDLPPILDRLGITPEAWLQLCTEFETHFSSWIGQAGPGRHWVRGIRACRRLFPDGHPLSRATTPSFPARLCSLTQPVGLPPRKSLELTRQIALERFSGVHQPQIGP